MQGEDSTTQQIATPPSPDVDEFKQQSDLDATAIAIGLTVKQAANALGKSLRAVERSLTGKWGNKLPDGWHARRIQTSNGLEWRLIPPAGFIPKNTSIKSTASTLISQLKDLAIDSFQSKSEVFKLSADLSDDHHTIVIDRSNDVEQLLRELLQTQKQLSEERRARLEDLRLVTQLQSSMRMLEDKASQTTVLKEELALTKQEFLQLKKEYLEFLALPWWKRLFRKDT